MDEQQQSGGAADGQLDIEFGDYRLIERVGEGGMAVVYKAHERVSSYAERLVCIKQILPQFTADPKFREMFHDEVRITSLLTHRNVCRIFRAGEVDDTLFMAMEFIDGLSVADLRDIVRARGQHFPVEHALHLCAEVMEGLHAAHTQTDTLGRPLRLVHRDVSPQNVLVSRTGEIKVIDFGVAKAASNMAHTRTGAVKGKLLYLSPEQLQAAELDGRSDIFSAGMMLYELLTDTHPFAGPDEHSTLFNYIAREIERPSRVVDHLPHEIDEVVMRAVAKDRDLRYATAAEMAHALTDALYHLAPTYRPYRFAEFITWALDDDAGPVPRVHAPSGFSQTGVGIGSPTTDPGLQVGGGGGDDWQGEVEFAPTLATEAVPVREDLREDLLEQPRQRAVPPQDAKTSTLEQPSRPPWVLFALIGAAVLGVCVVLGLIFAGGDGDDEAKLDGSDEGETEVTAENAGETPATGASGTTGTTGTAPTTDDSTAPPTQPDTPTHGTAPLGVVGDPGADRDEPADLDEPDERVDDGQLRGWGGSTPDDDEEPDDDDDDLSGWGGGAAPELRPLDELLDEQEDSAWGGGSTTGSSVQVVIDGQPIRTFDDLESFELDGQTRQTWEMTVTYLDGVKGTRLETYYKVAMYASQDQAAMIPLLNVFCAGVRAKPWTDRELDAIDQHMAGYDPCAWINP